MFQNIKLTQKIFIIFILMVILVMNSWAFTFTSVLDFRDSFNSVQQYSFPSVVTTSDLKDDVHIAMLAVYNYVATNNPESKTLYQERFTAAIQQEYRLFQLSQTTSDFEFTEKFNTKLLAVYEAADHLITTYEADPKSQQLPEQFSALNEARDDFNSFVETEITNQVSNQITQVNENINGTVRTIELFLIGVSALVLLIIVALIVFITNNISKPLRTLTEAAQAFGEGHFKRVTITRNDELGLFAKTFNTMASNIQLSQRALEAELAKTQQLDRQKSEFLSIAAHQLRTPMAGIRWVSQMLYDGDMGDLSTEQKHHLGNALENINRMINLINDLLDVTKIEEQKFNYHFSVLDVVALVKEQVAQLSNLAKETKIQINVEHEPAGDLLMEMDKDKLAMAFNNLIDNAIKYSKPGGIVEIHLTKHSNLIHGFVRDHGLGIPKNSHDEVFSKFFRAPNILKVVTEGSGLGLFLTKDIISKHDGKIWFESVEGSGTTFYFDLPIAQTKTDARPMLSTDTK